MVIDPYATPVSAPYATASAAGTAVTEGVLRMLAGTKPWVRLISVLMFIGAGFMLLGAVALLIGGGAIFANTKVSAYGAGFGVGIAVAYIVISLVYIYPALKLWKYASRIGSLLSSGETIDLERALNEQRAFWKFFGVIILLILGLYAVGAVVAIIVAVVGQTHA